jgi:lipid-A-disaccharide synthase
MKYYLIAGERSGDMHGANLIKALKEEDPLAVVRCWGGDAMQQAGADLVVHYRDLAFMGFLEVLQNLRTIRRFLKQCEKDLLAYQPDVLILIDYPGFNMRMAAFAKKQGIRVHYYISPKLWAWNQGRARKIKAHVDRMYVILPFEKDFYRKFDYAVEYVGNPLLDAVRAFAPQSDFRQHYGLDERPLVAVLPGSRKQEVLNMLNTMLEVARAYPKYQFAVAAVDNLPDSLYDDARRAENVHVIDNKTYDILHQARAALVTSGTATLETALFEVPQLVCYKTSLISYQIAKALIRVPYISLVNLIADGEVVPELIQADFNTQKLKAGIGQLMTDSPERAAQLQGYQRIKRIMGDARPSEKVAKLVVKALQSQEA